MKGIVAIMIVIVFAALVSAATLVGAATTTAAPIPRMTKEDLKQKLGDGNVVIIDVRIGSSWDGSEYKIRGAVREDPTSVSSWISKYPKEKTLVLYCS